MKLSVHVHQSPDPEQLDYLRQQLHSEVNLTVGPELPTPADYQVLVAGRPEPQHLTASPRLHAVVVPWAGIPEKTKVLMQDFSHISIHNLHHNAAPVAEVAVALLLAAAKFLLPLDRNLRNGDWQARDEIRRTILLQGKTALILGYGEIGRRVACICRALGMTVKATRRHNVPAREDGVDVYGPDSLDHLLPAAHALIVCLPLTPETKGLIGAEELALLPEGALLVNVGRGPVVEEQALYGALQHGTLRAAGLDVWYNYPPDAERREPTLPSTFPFHQLDNVVMSPHRAGGSETTNRLRMEHLAQLLNAAARGEPLPNRVDLAHGY